ncbi:hypothetical protein IFM89_006835 [Coptis chinensis]|uniref:Uncharacterized protein n=1 Tax=Coptis chinensis TaxID=261450 RepID=A0A835I6A9_9MAGN|nr:hypothetical protein IFM89_006835 [Coptis chinensis]
MDMGFGAIVMNCKKLIRLALSGLLTDKAFYYIGQYGKSLRLEIALLGMRVTVSGASAVLGLFASACSLPFDYVKSQIQKMQPNAIGKYSYSGSLDCVLKTWKAGGALKFYTEFPVYCVKIAQYVKPGGLCFATLATKLALFIDFGTAYMLYVLCASDTYLI